VRLLEKTREYAKRKPWIEVALVLCLFFLMAVFVFGEYVWDYYFSDVIVRDERVICQGSDCDVTFQVINRSEVNSKQEFYVGVWPSLDFEDPRGHGELGFSHALVDLRPHETKHCSVQVKLTHPRFPEGEHAMIQKAWWSAESKSIGQHC